MYWWHLLAAFWLGGLCAAVLFGLILMAGRDMFPPPERPRNDDPFHDMHWRDDGTRAVDTMTSFDVTDKTTPAQAWPLDRDKVRYRR